MEKRDKAQDIIDSLEEKCKRHKLFKIKGENKKFCSKCGIIKVVK